MRGQHGDEVHCGARELTSRNGHGAAVRPGQSGQLSAVVRTDPEAVPQQIPVEAPGPVTGLQMEDEIAQVQGPVEIGLGEVPDVRGGVGGVVGGHRGTLTRRAGSVIQFSGAVRGRPAGHPAVGPRRLSRLPTPSTRPPPAPSGHRPDPPHRPGPVVVDRGVRAGQRRRRCRRGGWRRSRRRWTGRSPRGAGAEVEADRRAQPGQFELGQAGLAQPAVAVLVGAAGAHRADVGDRQPQGRSSSGMSNLASWVSTHSTVRASVRCAPGSGAASRRRSRRRPGSGPGWRRRGGRRTR